MMRAATTVLKIAAVVLLALIIAGAIKKSHGAERPDMIRPQCWEENRGGQVYRHCGNELTPSPHRAPATKDEPPIAPGPPQAQGPPPGYAPRPQRLPGFAPGPPPPQCYTAWGWQPCAAPIPLGPPPPVYVIPPPVFFEPPVYYYVEPPPVYIEPPPYAYGPLPCTPKLSPYGGLGDGPFCQIVGDPWAW